MLFESEEAVAETHRKLIDSAWTYYFLDQQFCEAFEAEFGLTPAEWIKTREAQEYMQAEPEDSLLRRDYEDLQFEAKRRLFRF